MREKTEVTPTLEERVFQADQPIPRFGWSFAKPSARFRYRLVSHTPTALKLIAAELLGRLDAWRKPGALADARETSEKIVAGTTRASELEKIARKRLVELRVRQAIFWRSRWDRDAVIGEENMRAALESDRPVILTFCHLAAFENTFAPIGATGRATYLPMADWFFDPPTDNPWGYRLEHWRQRFAQINGRVVVMPGAFDVLHALLERGDVVMLAFDSPGNTETQFLGKPVMMASGTARLAKDTDAILLPTRRVRRGVKVAIEFAPPIDSRKYEDPTSLHVTLANLHSGWILEHPEGLEDPSREGFWEEDALPTGWNRPVRAWKSR
jgi:lauroyl/myristoyl acyltransferase